MHCILLFGLTTDIPNYFYTHFMFIWNVYFVNYYCNMYRNVYTSMITIKIFKDLFYAIRLKYQTRGAQTVKCCGRVEDMAENSLLIGPRK